MHDAVWVKGAGGDVDGVMLSLSKQTPWHCRVVFD
jgi:hypothetical protein